MSALYQTQDEFPILEGKRYTIPGVPISMDTILNRTNTIYGGSMSGKTTFVKFLMRLIAPVIGQVVVFCPSARGTNRDYSGIIPDALVHTEVDRSIFHKITHLQEARAVKYEHASNPKNIEKLYSFVRDRKVDIFVNSIERKYRELYRKKQKISNDPDNFKMEMKQIYKMIKTTKYNTYRNLIYAKKNKIPRDKLTKNEQTALDYIKLNPNILVIFDDCTEELRDITNKNDDESQEFLKYYTQGRWRNITIFTIVHDLGSFAKKLRSNSHNSFFSDITTAMGFVEGTGNNIMKPERDLIKDVVPEIYERPDIHKYNLLCYCKFSRPKIFYTHTPPPKIVAKGLRLCDPSIWKELEKYKRSSNTEISDDNIYKDIFDGEL